MLWKIYESRERGQINSSSWGRRLSFYGFKIFSFGLFVSSPSPSFSFPTKIYRLDEKVLIINIDRSVEAAETAVAIDESHCIEQEELNQVGVQYL